MRRPAFFVDQKGDAVSPGAIDIETAAAAPPPSMRQLERKTIA
jgi:hypothetical protein